MPDAKIGSSITIIGSDKATVSTKKLSGDLAAHGMQKGFRKAWMQMVQYLHVVVCSMHDQLQLAAIVPAG